MNEFVTWFGMGGLIIGFAICFVAGAVAASPPGTAWSGPKKYVSPRPWVIVGGLVLLVGVIFYPSYPSVSLMWFLLLFFVGGNYLGTRLFYS